MKNLFKMFGIAAIAAVIGFAMVACGSKPPPSPPPVDPEADPEISVEMIGEVFSLDPDNPDAPQPVANITVKHPVKIKDYTIQVQPIRRQTAEQAGQQQQRERPAAQPGDTPAAQEGERPARQQAPFFELKGAGSPPNPWTWDGKSSREPRQGRPRGMVQSATDYQLTVTVSDDFGNSAIYEGTLSVDVLVRREDDAHYRIIVPSIVFPPNAADLALVTDEAAVRSNRRILRLIGNALNKFPTYKVKVEGHANPTTPPGTPARTQEEAGTRTVVGLVPLSEARAKAVVDYLVANHQVDRARLSFVGIGGERTIAQWDDPEENANNRRVEFILEK